MMAERITVDPDIAACMREDRRIQLSHLVNNGFRVRVMNPLRNASWDGVIFGLADHPTLLMRLDDGRERAFPQHFAVEEIDPLPEVDGDGEEMWMVAVRIPAGTASEVWDQIRDLAGVEMYRAWPATEEATNG